MAKNFLFPTLNFMRDLKASFLSKNDLYQTNLAECEAVW